MKTVWAGTAMMVAAVACAAGPPKLGRGVRLQADGKDIDVEIGHLVPCVADWNGDGRKDLLVGQFKEGRIRVYLNRGKNEAPEFRDFELLAAGGRPIRLDAG